MIRIQNEKGDVIVESGLVLREQEKFYKKLYTKNTAVNFNIQVKSSKCISEAQRCSNFIITLTHIPRTGWQYSLL